MDLSQVRTIGKGLSRPEGVMVGDDGTIYAADARGCIARIEKDGKTLFWGDLGGVPNGICLDREGQVIVANIGNGRVQSLSPQGQAVTLMTEAEGRIMGSPNFPFMDGRDRLWVSNSTARKNIDEALAEPLPDGCVVLIEKGRPRIVAEGIVFANGLTLDAKEEFLYLAETMERRILRFRIRPDGSLTDREVYGPATLGGLGFPDGIAFDEAGNLWITFPALNAVGYLTPEHKLVMVLEDPQGKVLKRPTNICFGWKGRKTAFLGSLDGTTIPYFEAPFPGMKLIHQRV